MQQIKANSGDSIGGSRKKISAFFLGGSQEKESGEG